MSEGMADELQLLRAADRRARAYIESLSERSVFPDGTALARLERFNEELPAHASDPSETLALLDEVGSPATVASAGARYFGFVVGATLPVASAAERMVLAWDQCASSSKATV